MIPSLSIIIPAYNEEDVIEDTLKSLLQYFKNQSYDFEIIVVNDGCTDKTVQIVTKFTEVSLVDIANNCGKGNAVRKGIEKASKEYILFIDADHAIAIQNSENFIPFFPQYDIIIGSKYLNQFSKYPFHRKLIGKTFSFIKRLITGLKIKDTQCGFKLYKTSVAKEIFKKSIINGWCFDVEVLLIAEKNGCQIKELPIDVKSSKRVSRINVLGSGSQMFFDLLKVRINWILGRYH